MKNSIKKFFLLSMIFFILSLSLGTRADASRIKIKVNGQPFNDEETLLIDGRTYVPVRKFTSLLGAQVSWNHQLKQVTLKKGKITLQFVIGEKKAYLNQKRIFMDTAPIIENNLSYLPFRFVSEALYYNVVWEALTQTVSIKEKATYIVKEGDTLELISAALGIDTDSLKEWNKLTDDEIDINTKLYIESVELNAIDKLKTNAVIDYEEEELEWLARIIYSEARDEPYDGLVAVGAVVIHRVQSSWFPNSIYDVIFQPGQFTPATTGKIVRVEPDEDSYQAARDALLGVDPVEGALFFHNPKLSKSSFFSKKEVIRTIGNHQFLR